MAPPLRRLALTAHITASVGWLGAVVAFLALAIAGVTSQDSQVVRASYLAMELIGWYVLVPLAVASLLTGVVQSLGTPWGLLRHYWVLAKLLITAAASIVLLMYTQTLSYLAEVATDPTLDDIGVLRVPTAVLHSGLALVALLVTTVLAVYKPRGLTPYGAHKVTNHS